MEIAWFLDGQHPLFFMVLGAHGSYKWIPSCWVPCFHSMETELWGHLPAETGVFDVDDTNIFYPKES